MKYMCTVALWATLESSTILGDFLQIRFNIIYTNIKSRFYLLNYPIIPRKGKMNTVLNERFPALFANISVRRKEI